MATKKKLELIIKNQTELELKRLGYTIIDGELDESSIPDTIEANSENKVVSLSIKLKTKTGGQGPKGYIDYCVKDAVEKKFRIFFVLSKKSSNERCAYILPMGDYVFDGSYKMYGEGYWPVDTGDQMYKIEVTIGKPVQADVFYHITDTHFHSPEKNDADEQHKCVDRLMNKIINTEKKEQGENTEKGDIDYLNHVVGIIHTGDICYQDENDETFYKYFQRPDKEDFLSYSGNRSRWVNPFHLLEGIGNHDYDVARDTVRHWIISRNNYGEFSAKARMPETIVDNYDHMHYRWKWHGVNFIQLNLAPVDADRNGYDYHKAWSFLSESMKQIGDEATVLLFHVYCYTYQGEPLSPYEFMNQDDFNRLTELIKSTNIIAILNGHVHNQMKKKTYFCKDNQEDEQKVIKILNKNNHEVPVLRPGAFKASKKENSSLFIRGSFIDDAGKTCIKFQIYDNNTGEVIFTEKAFVN